MGVLCTEKHCSGEKCVCGGVSVSSPRPATLPSFPASPCENTDSSSQDSTNHIISRKRSLDASMREQDDSGIPASRRRTQRSPSAGSINGVNGHVISKEKLNSEISAIVGQNGFLKHESGLNGVKSMGHNYQNGTRPLCCLGLDTKAMCMKCVAHHHPTVNSSSLSSMSSALSPVSLTSSASSPSSSPSPTSCQQPQSSTSSASLSSACHNGNSDINIKNNSHHNDTATSVNTTDVSSADTTSTNAFATGSIAHPVLGDAINAKRPQPPSSLLPSSTSSLSSSLASSSSALSVSHQQQQAHQPTQGPKSSINLGSSNNKCSSNSSSSSDDKDSESLSSKCISASQNPTVLSLRQRPHSGNNNISAQKSSSQPASPQAAASSSSSSSSTSSLSSKSKSTLSSSSSSPSLSTLVTEPSSPSQPSTIQCKWRGCSCDLDASDLLEHIRKHAEQQIEKETYACLWTDCKVFNKPSWSGSWLERHIVSHSGHRPFKCILDNCGQRFHSQAALERHVNGHFTANSQNGAKSSRSREEINSRMLQKRRRQLKRRSVQTVKKNDFFDEQTMSVIKQELFSLSEHTQLDISGSALHTTFQGVIIGRRTTKSGSKECLMEFTPRNVIEDQWIPEENATDMMEVSIPLADLPNDTISNLHTSLYRRHRFRKHRRK